MDLDQEKAINLKVGEIVMLRNALREYVEQMHKLVSEDLNNNRPSAAYIHEKSSSDAIDLFWKLCDEW